MAAVLSDGADGALLEGRQLSAGGEDKAMVLGGDRGVAPEFLDGSRDAVNGDDHVGRGTALLVGKLDGGSLGLPAEFGSGCGQGHGREERRGNSGDVDELHFDGLVGLGRKIGKVEM